METEYLGDRRGCAMSSERATEETTSDRDVWRRLSWIFGLGGSIAMLYYEYQWSWFALHNMGTISFGGWCSTSFLIAAPWSFCLICLNELKGAVRNGKIGRDICMRISMWVEMVMLSAYGMLASEIHRLTSLGALK
jgi:hypothetical protein